jgi:hypothetical protein
MSRFDWIWLVVSLGISAGTNHLMKPHVPFELSIGDRSMPNGSLWLQEGGTRHELQIVTMRVVAVDVPRLLAAPIVVRELWLRSPEDASGAPPDLELFVDLSAEDGRAIEPHARDMGLLRGRALPVLSVRVEPGKGSRVRLPGSTTSVPVARGDVVISDVLELGSDATGTNWHVEGRIVLTLLDEGVERRLEGGFKSRLRWE